MVEGTPRGMRDSRRELASSRAQEQIMMPVPLPACSPTKCKIDALSPLTQGEVNTYPMLAWLVRIREKSEIVNTYMVNEHPQATKYQLTCVGNDRSDWL